MSSQHEQNTFVLTETTQTQMLREKMLENILLRKSPKWRTSKFRKKYLKIKTKTFFTGQGIRHVNVDLAVPPRMQN